MNNDANVKDVLQSKSGMGLIWGIKQTLVVWWTILFG